ncbi:pectin lyase-like protein [Exidia glandulosa HHB12029]|uniref:galacturonan 1,4-alpha-galacturonidase n=1 Tax=Exidia glandulosa HHB12029 TaxID=1314781 RepID=A0A165E620_EXIGL|nr:pectin lyase-like protein [Exidia glandulosa HHB12029]
MTPFLFLFLALATVSARPSCTLRASGGDDAPALVTALRSRTCSTVTVPRSQTLLIKSAMDTTSLKRGVHLRLEGTIKFNNDLDYWGGHAFPFDFQNSSTFWMLGGRDILLDGGGTIDGSGQAWWDAFPKNASLVRPIPLTLFGADSVAVTGIKFINSPFWFNLVHTSKNVLFSDISLHTQSTSSTGPKNTDGWDLYRSSNVVIQNSNIVNNDDCVSFKPNVTNILVRNLTCSGSHGISVGSLGQYPQFFDIAENIVVRDVSISNAQNGARIKVWAGPNVGSGRVNNVTYENVVVNNVDNPLIFDQCYMTSADLCAAVPSRVDLTNIFIRNISGTSSGSEKSVVADLNCSPGAICDNIHVDNFSVVPYVPFEARRAGMLMILRAVQHSSCLGARFAT